MSGREIIPRFGRLGPARGDGGQCGRATEHCGRAVQPVFAPLPGVDGFPAAGPPVGVAWWLLPGVVLGLPVGWPLDVPFGCSVGVSLGWSAGLPLGWSAGLPFARAEGCSTAAQ